MSFNSDLVERFESMAAMLELTGANRFKVNAYSKAARVIKDQTADLEAIAGDEKALTAIDGIGKGIAEKIGEYAETGAIGEHADLLASVPAGLLEVMRVPGLGPKTVKLMWEEQGIEDIDGLRAALESGKILELPRMGEKQAAKIKESLAFLSQSGKRLAVGLARPIAESIVERMLKVKGVRKAQWAGSMRRGRETVGDIDILALADDPKAAHEAFRAADDVVQVIAAGDSKSSVRVKLPDDLGRWKGFESDDELSIQVDLRVVPEESWGAALMYFTGSKEHNVKMREKAIKRGLTLNEYGLFEDDDPDHKDPPQKRGAKPVASESEEAIYEKLSLSWVPPELREDRGELDGEGASDLIEVGDIRAELHAHTTSSDGRMELKELVQKALDRGFHTICVTDHSASSAQAGGLNRERLEEQREAIEAAREKFGSKIQILAGSEVDILADGSLDFDDDTLAWLDMVVASPHTALDQDSKKATKRLLKAIENPFVDVLGHPTGRIINRRKGLEPAMDELIAAAKEHDTALEINSHWLRLDLRDTHVRAAVDAGVKIAIDCDVHAPDDFENIRYGVATGRRGGLTKGLCVNAMTKGKLAKWLGRNR